MSRCFTHRPGKVEGKLNGIRKAFILIALRIRQIEWVLPENGRHHIAVCALRCCVYGGLIMFQADTKPRLAGPNAFPCRRIRLPAAAMSLVIASMLIAKVFQAQFEIAGTVNLWGEKEREKEKESVALVLIKLKSNSFRFCSAKRSLRMQQPQ